MKHLVAALFLIYINTGFACEPIMAAGVFYGADYEEFHVKNTIPNFNPGYEWRLQKRLNYSKDVLGKVRVGIECGASSLVAEHYSSLETNADKGMNWIGIEVNFWKLLN